MTESVTIGERYRKATMSSNIRPEARRIGDADMLIAAGWSDSLGIKLYRLSGEFDQVARDVGRARSQTDAILILGRLKTLTKARAALVRYALESAPRWGVDLDQNIIGLVVGRVLSVWLEQNCQKCGGTGSIGGYDGKVKNVCRRCGGSGRNGQGLGKSDAERYFAKRLLSSMDAKMGEADAIMKRYLRSSA